MFTLELDQTKKTTIQFSIKQDIIQNLIFKYDKISKKQKCIVFNYSRNYTHLL